MKERSSIRETARRTASRPLPAPRAWRSSLWAGSVTVGLFVVLPYMVAVTKPASGARVVSDVDTVRLPDQPMPPPPRREETKPSEIARSLPRPRLAEPRRLVPVNAVLDLGLTQPGAGSGLDVGFDFAPAPTSVVSDLGDTVFELADLEDPPQPLVQVEPAYPPSARMRNVEGMVMVEFVVWTDGSVRSVRVTASHPGDLFVNAVMRAAERWRFRPGVRGGKPVPVRVRQKVTFRLEGGI